MQPQKVRTEKNTIQCIEPIDDRRLMGDVSPSPSVGSVLKEGEETAGKWAVMAIIAIGVFMATLRFIDREY